MSTDDPNPDGVFADDDSITKEVPLDRENTLQRIREDYDEPPKGTIREAIQNSGDAFGENRERGVLSEDDELEITFVVDTEEMTLTYEDTAGGMDRETVEENLIGIDTPDENKAAGDRAGAYGRGFHVVSMCGEGKTYAETRHGDEHHGVTLTNEGKYSDPTPPEDPQLPDDVQGTHIHVADVLEHDMEKLSDWDWVEDVLL